MPARIAGYRADFCCLLSPSDCRCFLSQNQDQGLPPSNKPSSVPAFLTVSLLGGCPGCLQQLEEQRITPRSVLALKVRIIFSTGPHHLVFGPNAFPARSWQAFYSPKCGEMICPHLLANNDPELSGNPVITLGVLYVLWLRASAR